jgi:hypothetical protein
MQRAAHFPVSLFGHPKLVRNLGIGKRGDVRASWAFALLGNGVASRVSPATAAPEAAQLLRTEIRLSPLSRMHSSLSHGGREHRRGGAHRLRSNCVAALVVGVTYRR